MGAYNEIVILAQGRTQTMWKLWFHKLKLSNLHKIGKYGKEIGEKSGKLSTKFNKIRENQNFHI